MKTRTTALAAVLAVLLLGVAAVASGCGSSSTSDDGVAALDDASTSTSETEERVSADEDDPEEAALDWAKCMREHGVDVPDPEIDGEGRLTVRAGAGRRLDRVDGKAFQAAQKECGMPFGRSGGPPALSDEQREELQESMLEFARCMREHGVDMPDPEFSSEGGGVMFRVGPGPGSFDRDSEQFREAQKACDEILQRAMPERPGRRNVEDGDAE